MTIAFYAPLKAPDHSVPSGDRAIARALMAAIRYGGQRIAVASDLRLYDGQGEPATQAALAQAATEEIDKVLSDPSVGEWRLWLTYHNYYKAPDLVGPKVSSALNIPYVQVESTRAKRRLTGPWASFAAAAEEASDSAKIIFYFTQHDALTLRRDAPAEQRLVHIPPFLSRSDLPDASTRTGPMLTVAMMRHGDKLASYRLIAEALAQVDDTTNWQLNIAGDGPAASDVKGLMARFTDRITFLGALTPQELAAQYSTARLLFWPGVNEAFGMVYLEAQAAGIPVIAQDRAGVRDVTSGTHPHPDEGPAALARRIERLYAHPNEAAAEGEAARGSIEETHLLPHAAETLMENLRPLL